MLQHGAANESQRLRLLEKFSKKRIAKAATSKAAAQQTRPKCFFVPHHVPALPEAFFGPQAPQENRSCVSFRFCATDAFEELLSPGRVGICSDRLQGNSQ